MRTVNTKTQAKNIAKEASDHKAKDIVVMDLRHVASFADYFVICSGGSERHVQAIADAVAFDQKKRGKKLLGEEIMVMSSCTSFMMKKEDITI